ncbi:MAG: heavy metal translocating P-type ATPase [Acidimicrobiales bacterium]|nr:heavy metal translocating P-type ATPase [Acidimicrobiales bacterium]
MPTAVETDLTIEGMTCAACVQAVETGLSRVDGVASAHVNLATGRARVDHDAAVAIDELRAAVQSLGYGAPEDGDAFDAHAEREADLARRVVQAAVLTVPLALISMVPPVRFSGWEWVAAGLATPVVFGPGRRCHQAALAAARHGVVSMDALVSVSTLAAWLWSAVVLFADLEEPIYFETTGVIITLILFGSLLEVRAKRRSGDAIRALADLGAQDVRLEDGREVPIEELAVGDRFVARPGERIATDGIVVDGHAAVDVSMLTGEPVPDDVAPGSPVIGATICLDGSLTIEASNVGADTALAQIVRLVDEAQQSKAPIQRLADRVSGVFVPVSIGISIVTLLTWLATGQPVADGFTAAVAVLIIACPCALGLATPMALMVGTGRAAQLGVLVGGAEVLEDSRRISTIVLDKTGTITAGRMSALGIRGPGGPLDDLLEMAAALEASSEHPIGVAIAQQGTQEHDVRGFYNDAGRGVVGAVDGVWLRVGRREFFDVVSADVDTIAAAEADAGRTVVFVGRGGDAEAVIALTDEIKPTSAEAITALAERNLDIVMLTGDNEGSARAAAQAVGIEDVVAGVLPDQKAEVIERLRGEGRVVAMVGDGINDAPALAAADLGIAIGTGTDIAIQASDLTLVQGDLRSVVTGIDVSRRTFATIKANLFWAFVYNAAAIPLAASGVLDPMIAAAAMSLSSLCVMANSLRLRTFGSRPQT